jgi:hypothetical protein
VRGLSGPLSFALAGIARWHVLSSSAFELTVWLMICTHRRAYQRSILFWSVVLSMGTLGGLWYALVQTKLNDDLVPDGGDGSSSNDGGTFSERQLLRRYVVVTVFLTVEILVRASS